MNQHLLLYDGGCPLCVSQMRLLARLDWFNALALVPLTDPLAHEAAPQLSRDQLLAAMHCVAKDGRIYRGARCIRHIGMRLPLLVPLTLLLWVPGMLWIAEKVYSLVARNRHVLSRVFRCEEACAVNVTWAAVEVE